MKKVKVTLWLLAMFLLFMQSQTASAVEVTIAGGISNDAVKAKMERTLSAILTEVNAAYEQNRSPRYASLSLPSDVETTISSLWENAPFFCIDDEVIENCLTLSGGNKYQIRNIPLLLKSGADTGISEDEDYQEAVATFDSSGNILSFNLSISMTLYMDVLNQHLDVTDARYRELILDWVEQFRTAYNERNIPFMDAVFSDDALIITGKVMVRRPGDVPLPSQVQYTKQTKQQYLTNLTRLFNNKKYIKVTFDQIKVMRHPNPQHSKVYGVTLHQGFTSDTYHDEGYVFLLWDFEDEDHPKIHVRTWQPDEYVKEEDVFDVSDFDF